MKKTKRKRRMPNPQKQVMNYLEDGSQGYKISGGGWDGRNHCCSHWWLLLRQEVSQDKKGAVEKCYLGRKEAVPVPGPIGGGSLSGWKEPEVKEKEDGGPDNLSSADEVPTKLKLKEPEDNPNLNPSSAKD